MILLVLRTVCDHVFKAKEAEIKKKQPRDHWRHSQRTLEVAASRLRSSMGNRLIVGVAVHLGFTKWVWTFSWATPFTFIQSPLFKIKPTSTMLMGLRTIQAEPENGVLRLCFIVLEKKFQTSLSRTKHKLISFFCNLIFLDNKSSDSKSLEIEFLVLLSLFLLFFSRNSSF